MTIGGHGLHQSQVRTGIVAVRFRQDQIHQHRPGAHLGQPVDNVGVNLSVPGPTAYFPQAVFIDTDDHQVTGGFIRQRMQQVVVDIAIYK